jgi:hypothetical protein
VIAKSDAGWDLECPASRVMIAGVIADPELSVPRAFSGTWLVAASRWPCRWWCRTGDAGAGREALHPDPQRPGAVECPGEHVVTDGLVHRQRSGYSSSLSGALR